MNEKLLLYCFQHSFCIIICYIERGDTMKTELYLVRHGETEWNKLQRFQGTTDIHLAEEGIQQAEYLNKRFLNNFDCVYVSPLSRAKQTAEILCNESGIKPIIHKGLIEINFGAWEGLSLKEIKETYPEEYHKWRTDDEVGYFMGGDLSIKNASNRAKDTILDIVEKNPGKKIVAVAHGAIIKAGLIGLFNWKMSMYHSIFLDNTAVTKLIFNNDRIILASLNDTRHLPID